MTYNPLSEVRYRHRLAMEHLKRAEKLYSLEDWVGVVSASQLAVENFAKAIIAVFEVPTWSHDPSNRLKSLTQNLPSNTAGDAEELAQLAREMAPEPGRSTYGEPAAGLAPSEIYRKNHASKAIKHCKKAEAISQEILKKLNVKL